MDLSAKEKKLLIAAIIALGIMFGDKLLLKPLVEKRNMLKTQNAQITSDLEQARNILERRKLVKQKWVQMQESGLTNDPQKLESSLFSFLEDASGKSGLEISYVQPGISESNEGFGLIDFTLSGRGTMRSVTEFLWEVETCNLPVLIGSFQLGALDENGQNVSIQLELSALHLQENTKEKS